MRRSRYLLVVGILSVAADGAAGQTPQTNARAVVREEIARAAARHGVDPRLADAVAKVESGYHPHARSAKGAVGVMQLMPGTAHALKVNSWDYRQNIEAGVSYLRWLLKRYNGDTRRALAAYNAGPTPVETYGGVPPYPETKAYVAWVLSEYYGRPVPVQSKSAATRPKAKRSEMKPTCSGGVQVSLDRTGRLYVRSCSER